jgi:2-isopropylmalate synthase
MADKVIIFDTTLRDGEQSPGVALNIQDKLEIARQLEKLRVDVIEAGFPISSPGDFECVTAVSREIKRCTVAGLAHAAPAAVDACWDAVKGAAQPRIHIFLSSSDIHMAHQLRKDREQVLEMARTQVARAKGYVSDVEFSPMDASRSDPEYVYQMLEQVIAAGATTVNIPDTVGYSAPEEFAAFIRNIFEKVPNIDKAIVSVHCHNDLGMAVANSLAAVLAGARQVECCVNGIGERAGNASLEEVVMALKTRHDLYGVTTGVNSKEIYRTSRLISDLTGIVIQPNKAIVGGNAFRHQSGIHQDGILKMRETYEIMDAKEIGLPSGGAELVLGKLSGRHAFRERLRALGYELSGDEFSRAFADFKELADKKAEIDDRDIEALIGDELRTVEETYHLVLLQVSCGNHLVATATVRLRAPGGQEIVESATGTGPVDAAFKAIDAVVGVPNTLLEFSVKSITAGIDALGEVLVRVQADGNTYVGRGADTDIVVAAAKALMNALNRMPEVQRRATEGESDNA